MNQIRRCIAVIGLALALTGWSAESVAWHKGAYHSEPEPWEVQEDGSGSAEQIAAPAEQLKATTVEFDVGKFVPPPRTISDITTILDDKGHAGSDAATKEISG